MYTPKHFAETRLDVLHEAMRAYPLAMLATQAGETLDANHIPLYLAAEPAPLGALQGHVARANPLWREADGRAALAVFRGPDAYITPSWYPGKAQDGRAVPTWNYLAVHAHGRLRAIDDPAWIRAHLEALTARHEALRPHPWRLDDAPADFVDKLIGAVVGIEIVIDRLEGKRKLGQNQPAPNRAGAAAGLRAGGHEALARLMEDAAD